MTVGERIAARRKELNMTQEELAKKLGYKSRSSINKIELEWSNVPLSKLEKVASALECDACYLMGWDDTPRGLSAMPDLRRVPRVGRIACGEPVLAQDNLEGFDDVPSFIHCEFTLVCKGDSMMNARIFDGDLVCISTELVVHSGDIAAVLADEEDATLKRVRIFPDHIVLEPENPKYRPMVFWEEEMKRVRIIGKATHFISTVW